MELGATNWKFLRENHEAGLIALDLRIAVFSFTTPKSVEVVYSGIIKRGMTEASGEAGLLAIISRSDCMITDYSGTEVDDSFVMLGDVDCKHEGFINSLENRLLRGDAAHPANGVVERIMA